MDEHNLACYVSTLTPEKRFCGGCGDSLTSSGHLIPHREHSLVPVRAATRC
jgi:hypothetical protein